MEKRSTISSSAHAGCWPACTSTPGRQGKSRPALLGKLSIERALKHLEPKDEQKDKDSRKAPTLRDLQRYYSSAPDDLPDDIRPFVTEDVRTLCAHWLGIKYQPRRQEQVA
jgi:hypothetical protein